MRYSLFSIIWFFRRHIRNLSWRRYHNCCIYCERKFQENEERIVITYPIGSIMVCDYCYYIKMEAEK